MEKDKLIRAISILGDDIIIGCIIIACSLGTLGWWAFWLWMGLAILVQLAYAKNNKT